MASKGGLELTIINLHIPANRKSHHTDKYISNELILRRGQPFKVSLTFNRALKRERIAFTLETGPQPDEVTNTRAVFPLSRTVKPNSWGAVKSAGNGSSRFLEISISSPRNAIIGRYSLSVQISENKISSHKLGNLVLLFNPWASGDSVFLGNHEEREEYVLNDGGIIYLGNADQFGGNQWDYGQFEENILRICLALLDRNLNYKDSKKDYSHRNDPAYVGRVCTAMVNAAGDNGVLQGRWNEPYTGGVRPTTWSGSAAILRKWDKDSFQPVKYGQCWVFGGVLCTVLRCLGIPARTITNFESAHDTDVNLSIDEYYKMTGERQGSQDSVWNFHVWNEGWFTRPDLGSAYDGWQVLDATPQELSEGKYQCGPTSVKAIKEGDIDLGYDAPFVFAEVNADRTTWLILKDETKWRVKSNSSSIGKYISTKAVGSTSRMDVTNNYKYPEGSDKERYVFKKASRKLFKTGVFAESLTPEEWLSDELIDEFSDDSDDQESEEQFSGEFQLSESAQVGQDINAAIAIKNPTSENKTVNVKICAYAITYTRTPGATIIKHSVILQLSPNEEKQIPLKISYCQYENALTEDNMIKVSALCEDEQGKKLLVEKDIVLTSPPITIKVPEKIVIKQTFKVEVVFQNPLSEVLKNCSLLLEGSGLLKEQLMIKVEDMKPHEMMKIPVEITPFTKGTRQLLANLVCDQFSKVKGFQNVDVAQNS
ncbi:protein-glutamine gamma-glutamyltransferase E-like [Lissotriton helveticus]